MSSTNSIPVAMAPNESLISARVVSTQSEPDGHGQTVRLTVLDSQSIDELPNLTRSIVGQTVPFYLSESRLLLRAGDRIEAKATYRGGPSGGRYSILPDDIRKIE